MNTGLRDRVVLITGAQHGIGAATAKAFAGMLAEIDKGSLGKNDPVIFLHTGGLPALFAFPDEI